MEDLAEQFARRDRLMRHMAAQLTPEQRVARGRALEEWAIQVLHSNPEGLDRFMRRNLRSRAIARHDNRQNTV